MARIAKQAGVNIFFARRTAELQLSNAFEISGAKREEEFRKLKKKLQKEYGKNSRPPD